MTIETKFNVGDLIQHKYQSHSDTCIILQCVMEIQTQTCYAGTQNFYHCRTIIFKRDKKRFSELEYSDWEVHHGIGENDFNVPKWHKYREDELISAPKRYIDLVKSILNDEKDMSQRKIQYHITKEGDFVIDGHIAVFVKELKAKDFNLTEREAKNQDMPNKYAVVKDDKANGGIIVYAEYDGEWVVNPFSTRFLIRILIEELQK